MSVVQNLVTCYNKGCGKKYDPENNHSDSCRFHPGEPFFHDAYKGWSCCKQKCTDFTEFLNIPGCTVSQHSNVKLPEKPKPMPEENSTKVIKVKPPVVSTVERLSLDTSMTILKPQIAPNLRTQNKNIISPSKSVDANETNIPLGTHCKNGGCNKTYEGSTDEEICTYHPGNPVFHEGLKYWSCCQRRTTDFNAFLQQIGCVTGKHIWFKKGNDIKGVDCRWDWHQTENFVVLTVYAKNYCPDKSIVQANPIRVFINLVFPPDDNTFTLDLELIGVVNVEQSEACMFGTKLEVNLKKMESGNWSTFHVPKISETKLLESDDASKNR